MGFSCSTGCARSWLGGQMHLRNSAKFRVKLITWTNISNLDKHSIPWPVLIFPQKSILATKILTNMLGFLDTFLKLMSLQCTHLILQKAASLIQINLENEHWDNHLNTSWKKPLLSFSDPNEVSQTCCVLNLNRKSIFWNKISIDRIDYRKIFQIEKRRKPEHSHLFPHYQVP